MVDLFVMLAEQGDEFAVDTARLHVVRKHGERFLTTHSCAIRAYLGDRGEDICYRHNASARVEIGG